MFLHALFAALLPCSHREGYCINSRCARLFAQILRSHNTKLIMLNRPPLAFRKIERSSVLSVRPHWKIALLYFACLALIGLYRDNATQPGLLVDVAEFLRVSVRAGSDPHTFAKTAAEVAQHGWITPSSQWVFRLWPPGFILLVSAIFKVGGVNAPFLLIIFFFSVLLGALMLTVIRQYLLNYVSPRWAAALPLIPFLFPVTRFSLLQPLGLALGEGFAMMFFITAFFVVLAAIKAGSVKLGVAAGALFSASAYFRSQYELIVVFMAIAAIPTIAYLLLSRKASKECDSLKAVAWVIFVTVLTTHLLMLPWRIHNFFDLGALSWVHTQDLIARNSLTPVAKLLELGGGFVVEGGGHLGCQLAQQYCNSVNAVDFYRAFSQNMGEWYFQKIALLDDFWFSSVAYFPKKVKAGVPSELVGNGLMLFALLVSLILVWCGRMRRNFVPHLWMQLSFYACFFVIFSLVHFETRYFYLMKVFALYSAIVLACEVWADRRVSWSRGDADPGRVSNLRSRMVK